MSSSPKQPLLQPDHLSDIPTSAYAAARHAQLLERLRRWLETSPLWSELRVWFLTQPERWRGWPTASRLATLALSAGLTVGVVGQPVVALAQEPVGGEFRVNSYTTFSQRSPDVAMDADGNFVVVWKSNQQDSSPSSIYAQRFNVNGIPQGSEFQVNTYTSNIQEFPSVAMDKDGNFVVAWESYQQDGDYYGVYAQRYNANGIPLGSEFQVNTYTLGEQRVAKVAMDADGDFVVVWISGEFFGPGQDGSGYGVYAQRYGANGNPIGGEFRVNTYTTNFQRRHAVAMDSDGDFVVTWTSTYQDGSGYGVYAQRYDMNGNALGGEFRVNTTTTENQMESRVAMDADGNFIVVWRGYEQGTDNIYAQRYSIDGNNLGDEFQINSYVTGLEVNPAIAMGETGDFVVVWTDGSLGQSQDGSIQGIFARYYSVDNKPQGGEFQVNSYTTGNQQFPNVAIDDRGVFVITWQSDEQDGSDFGVYAQRYRFAPSTTDQEIYLPLLLKE